MVDYLPFIILLMILAVYLRANSALTVIYLLLGTFFLALWWNKRALEHLEVTRTCQEHAFSGEHMTVQLLIQNRSILPILWLEIAEGLSVDLRVRKSVKQVFSLGPHEKKMIAYELYPKKRGYYDLGPLRISSGDPLGLLKPTQKEFPSSCLTVYPQIVHLSAFGLPSQSPFGTIKHPNPIFEDPNRIIGKRDYQNGDSMRRIDWKSTAATGQLQVKLYEASISLQVAIILDLHRDSYDIKNIYSSSELAIIAAASVAAWGKAHQQTVGLFTNAADPLNNNHMPNPMQPKKGAGHFINILEILARIQTSSNNPLEDLILSTLTRLSWGATVVVISGGLQESTLIQLDHARKKGVQPVVILTGQLPNFRSIKDKASYYHIDLIKAIYPQDLKSTYLNN